MEKFNFFVQHVVQNHLFYCKKIFLGQIYPEKNLVSYGFKSEKDQQTESLPKNVNSLDKYDKQYYIIN